MTTKWMNYLFLGLVYINGHVMAQLISPNETVVNITEPVVSDNVFNISKNITETLLDPIQTIFEDTMKNTTEYLGDPIQTIFNETTLDDLIFTGDDDMDIDDDDDAFDVIINVPSPFPSPAESDAKTTFVAFATLVFTAVAICVV